MLTGIFDSHAHYDDAAYQEDRDPLLSSLPERGVCRVLNVGCDIETSFRSAALAEQYPFFYAAAGVHPEMAAEVSGDWLEGISALLDREKVVAIGEIGLDYHYDTPSREVQQEVFEAQLELAVRKRLPVIIHSRDAMEDTFALLREYRPEGVLHCFSGSAESAKEAVRLGLYLGFTGVLTFKNARRALEAVEAVPADRLLLETDCPYMAPEPFRGKRCTSDLIAYTAEAMARIKSVSPQEMIDQARRNANRLFRLPD